MLVGCILGVVLFVVSVLLVESEVIGVCEVADVDETESGSVFIHVHCR